MKMITREELDEFVRVAIIDHRNAYDTEFRCTGPLWSRIQEVQSSEPMSVDQVEPVLRKVFCDKFVDSQPTTEWMDTLLKMAKAIQPLTVKQGFVVDWSKAPKGKPVTGIQVTWSWWDNEEEFFKRSTVPALCYAFIPRPAPKMRPKTRDEKVDDLRGNAVIMNWPTLGELKDSTIDDLCLATGIPLEATE